MTGDGTSTEVHIVRTGVANTASVCAGIKRLGCAPVMVTAAAQIRDAAFVVLPGVGAFAAAMTQLRSMEFAGPLRQRIADDRPTLAICLGLQLLGTGSDEAPQDTGLQCVAGVAEGFTDAVRVPHMGWNRVTAGAGCRLIESGAAYFAHSYRWRSAPPGWAVGTTPYEGRFVAAAEKGAVLACQFHPELSGDYGAGLLRRWLQNGGATC